MKIRYEHIYCKLGKFNCQNNQYCMRLIIVLGSVKRRGLCCVNSLPCSAWLSFAKGRAFLPFSVLHSTKVGNFLWQLSEGCPCIRHLALVTSSRSSRSSTRNVTFIITHMLALVFHQWSWWRSSSKCLWSCRTYGENKCQVAALSGYRRLR